MLLAWLLLIFSISNTLLANELPLQNVYYGINTDFTMPMIEITNASQRPELKGGIFKDIGEALSKELQIHPIFILLPKNRIGPALTTGSVDIVCHMHEAWSPKEKDLLLWSHELYKSTNIIAYLGKQRIRTIKDLYNHRLGVINNFIYHSLNDAFEKKLILREGANNIEGNIRKLIFKRIDYIVMSTFEYQYYKKIHPDLQSFPLTRDTISVKCAISKKSKIHLNKLNNAIDALKKNDAFKKILNAY